MDGDTVNQDYLSIPGYLPIKEAAVLMGLSTERVLQHVRAKRLPCRKIAGRYLIPLAALSSFKRKPHGRIRTSAVAWRCYRTATVFVRQVDVPVCSGQLDAVMARLDEVAREQRHCFPGTMQRLISAHEHTLSLLLVWKSTELDEAALQQSMCAFREEFADLLNWQVARDMTGEAMAYT